jgi:hypothetical protein
MYQICTLLQYSSGCGNPIASHVHGTLSGRILRTCEQHSSYSTRLHSHSHPQFRHECRQRNTTAKIYTVTIFLAHSTTKLSHTYSSRQTTDQHRCSIIPCATIAFTSSLAVVTLQTPRNQSAPAQVRVRARNAKSRLQR